MLYRRTHASGKQEDTGNRRVCDMWHDVERRVGGHGQGREGSSEGCSEGENVKERM